MTSLSDNAPRFQPGVDSVESWFLRANHPSEPRAIWVKATVLSRSNGESVAEAWCSLFDGARTLGLRETVPLAAARFEGAGDRPLDAAAGELRLRLDADGGSSSGELGSKRGTVRWDLALRRLPGALGEPLCLLPSRRLIDAPVPRNKLLTPFPAALVSGRLEWDGQVWELADWPGMQGHNWGAAHSPEYAWGHCLFLDGQGRPFALVEGASGRIRLGPVTTPLLSLLTVRRGEREYRFDRLVDLWRQAPQIRFPDWTLRMRGAHGEATLAMRADPARMVCLGYDNPASPRGYCLNSKTAAVTLRVNPVNEHGFECTSPHGGALEFLQPTEEPRVQPVV